MGVINIKKEILIGFLVSIFATFCGIFIYVEYVSRFGFYETLEMIEKGNFWGQLITLASLPNLLVFFVFLKKNKVYRARGVIVATIFIALITLVIKFL